MYPITTYVVSKVLYWSVVILGLISLLSSIISTRIYDIDSMLILQGAHQIVLGQSPYIQDFYYPYFFAIILSLITEFPESIWSQILFFTNIILIISSVSFILSSNKDRLLAISISFLFPPILWNINTGQVDIFLIFFISLYIFFLKKHLLLFAGVILPFFLMKPQIGGLILVFILMNHLIRKEYNVIKSFIIVFTYILLTSFTLNGSWFNEWMYNISIYQSLPNNNSSIGLSLFINNKLSLVLLFIVSWYFTYKMKYISHAEVIVYSILISILFSPISHVYDLSVLIIPVLFLINFNRFFDIFIIIFHLAFWKLFNLSNYFILTTPIGIIFLSTYNISYNITESKKGVTES